MKTTNELTAPQLRLIRKRIGKYHAETEEMIRVLEALSQAGLTIAVSVKSTQRAHDLLEGLLVKLDEGTFVVKDLSRIIQLLDDGIFPRFDADTAFEKYRGRVVNQLRAAEKAWDSLNDLVMGGDLDVEIPDLEAHEAEAAPDDED